MYELVADVGRYGEFLPWVSGVRITSNSETEMVADLLVGFKAIKEKFNKAVAEINERPDMKARLLEMGFVTRSMPLKELKEFYLADDQLYKKIIREQKITID